MKSALMDDEEQQLVAFPLINRREFHLKITTNYNSALILLDSCVDFCAERSPLDELFNEVVGDATSFAPNSII